MSDAEEVAEPQALGWARLSPQWKRFLRGIADATNTFVLRRWVAET